MLTIIVEAPDCAGKTTLLSNLRKRIENDLTRAGVIAENAFEDVHCTYPPKGLSQIQQIEHQRNEYDNYIDAINHHGSTNKVWLFDRFMTGELIYGPKYRNYSPDYIHEFEKRLNVNQTYFITLVADPAVIESRFDGEFIKATDIAWLVDEYKAQFDQCEIKRKLLLDVSKLNPQQVCNAVYDFISRGLMRHIVGLLDITLDQLTDRLEAIGMTTEYDVMLRQKARLKIFQNESIIAESLDSFKALSKCDGVLKFVHPTRFVLTNGYYLEPGKGLSHSKETDHTELELTGYNAEYKVVHAKRGDTDVSIHGGSIQHISFV